MKYILKGRQEEAFHPHFSWMGFRFVEVDGHTRRSEIRMILPGGRSW